jgi:hypothetical protein
MKEIKNVLPTNIVKCFPNIELEKDSRSLCFVEPSVKILHIEEVVWMRLMGLKLPTSSALRIGHEVVHEWAKPKR